MRTSARGQRIGDYVFFLDKCLGKEDVRNALIGLGARTEIHSDHFEQSAADAEWIPEVGQRGWIILSKDRSIRGNALEVRALIDSGTAAFLLTSANMTGEAMARAYTQAMPNIIRMLGKYQRPFIATVTEQGGVNYTQGYSAMVKIASTPNPRAKG